MNIAAHSFEQENDFAMDFGRPVAKSTSNTKTRKSDQFRRKRKAPQQFNGIHRRRKKKIRW